MKTYQQHNRKQKGGNFQKTVGFIRETVENPDLASLVRVNDNDFIRSGKIGCENWVKYLLLPKKCLTATHLQMFSSYLEMGTDTIAASSYSEARYKVKPDFFRALLQGMAQDLYEHGHWVTLNGFRIIAIDGIRINVPKGYIELVEEFGIFGGDHGVNQSLGSVSYDVLNRTILDGTLGACTESERALGLEHVAHIAQDGIKSLYVMDRGYPGKDFIDRLEAYHASYLIRCKVGANNTVKGIVKDYKEKGNKQHDQVVFCPVLNREVRIIIVPLKVTTDNPDGIEVLITNVSKDEISTKDAFEIYGLRWRTETNYNILKNIQCLTTFRAGRPEGIKQEFYIALIHNVMLHAKLNDAKTHMEPHNPKHKHKKQASTGSAYETFCISFIEIVYRPIDAKVLNDSIIVASKITVQIKENRARMNRTTKEKSTSKLIETAKGKGTDSAHPSQAS